MSDKKPGEAMDTEEIIKRWGATKAGIPDEWESVAVEFDTWSVWYSSATGGDEGTTVSVMRGRQTLWSSEIKYTLGDTIREILAFGQQFDSGGEVVE